MAARSNPGLSVGQVTAAVFGFLVASFLIFVSGMWVGKDLAERRLAQEERVIRGPVAVVTPQELDVRDPDITFYDRLAQPQEEQGLVIAPGAAAPTRSPALGGVAVATPRSTETRIPPTRATTPVRVVPSWQGRKEEWADAGWTVQVSATTEPNEALTLVARLRAKGFEAYTVRAPMRGQTWYRVRVGHFTTREQAREVERRLKTQENLSNAYVTPR